jgi:alpha-glucosidase (family GH31 glycosyl hydrolase)
MERASRTGIPPMRALIFEYPADNRFLETDQEFLFGTNLLVAPVLMESETTKQVTFPRDGAWYDYATGRRYDAGSSVKVDAPPDRLPLFARNGSVIATRNIVQFTGEAPIDPLILTVFPPDSGATGTGDLYEDDGLSFAFTKGAFSRRAFATRHEQGKIILALAAAQGSYVPPPRTLTVRFLALPAPPVSVKVDGKAITGWRYDPSTNVLTLSLQDNRSARNLAVGF